MKRRAATDSEDAGASSTAALGAAARIRRAAAVFAVAGVALSFGVPFLLGTHAMLPSLRALPACVFAVLAASAVLSALAKAGKQLLLQSALGIRLGFARTLAITVVTDFAFLVSPLGAAGYGVNMALLQRTGASWASATAAVGADQALDLLFFGTAIPLGLAFALAPLSAVFPTLDRRVALGLIAGLAAAVYLFWRYRRQVGAGLDATAARIPWLRLRHARVREFRRNVHQQVALLLAQRRWRLFGLLWLTATQWLLRYGVLWFALLELGYRLPLGLVLVVQGLVLHAALWTGVPAGGGSGDLGLAAAFAPWVPASVMAIALILWRFATLYCPLLLGCGGFAALALWRRTQRPASAVK
ncbi:hypothetical protein PATSB16_19470 [Pandoraea thiooxydans]|uniref:TIGR00374 family protein n=1 Tax=Pandoraea thiooxydans TaxID=445709 RepID=A0A0G3ELW4_9BURK|nr:lysylphosphatidylglycerol synthase transmembrane domain-containing protein [Pandoraea thiooxydans]AKJ68043.1 hypothetical protein ABW99_07285 [Pandoraea thiooxydans]APR95287.1 hypothetical protein PATSB16_19470 [Pandoraea thiooxydans]